MGGGRTHLERFVPALQRVRPGWELCVYVSDDQFTWEGVDVRCISVGRRGRTLWDAWQVGRVSARSRGDVLVNLANYGPVRSPVPSVLYQRNALYFDPRWLHGASARARAIAWARRLIAFAQVRGAALVVVPSRAMEGFLRAWPGFPSSVPVEVVPHGVDLEALAFEPAATGSPARIVSLGHAAPHKELHVLVDMMAALVRRGVDVRLEMSAATEDDPGTVGDVEQRIAEAGLGDRVALVGRVGAAEFLRGAQVAVQPAATESFGFAVVEAMAAGVPVVASSIPASRELLGNLGWYFEVGDAEGAAACVEEVLQADRAVVLERMQGARLVAEALTWERNAEQVAAAIERVLQRSRS